MVGVSKGTVSEAVLLKLVWRMPRGIFKNTS